MLCAWQVPYQLDYVKRVVAEAKAKREGTSQLMTQRLTSSVDITSSMDAAAAPPEPAADGQFNTDVGPPKP